MELGVWDKYFMQRDITKALNTQSQFAIPSPPTPQRSMTEPRSEPPTHSRFALKCRRLSNCAPCEFNRLTRSNSAAEDGAWIRVQSSSECCLFFSPFSEKVQFSYSTKTLIFVPLFTTLTRAHTNTHRRTQSNNHNNYNNNNYYVMFVPHLQPFLRLLMLSTRVSFRNGL